MPEPYVIDLSHHNDVADWNAIRAAGILGVIHKASEGSDYVDPTYSERRAAAEAAGLLWGAYHFLRPVYRGTMKEQAHWFVANATPTPRDLICVDYEDDTLTLDDLTAFLDAVQSLIGRQAVIYSGHTIKEQVGDDCNLALAASRLWIAQYADAPTWPAATWPQWWLWQYSDGVNGPGPHGVPGVSGDVDLNAFAGTEDDLRASWANGAPAPAPDPRPPSFVTLTLPPGARITIGSGGATVTYPERET